VTALVAVASYLPPLRHSVEGHLRLHGLSEARIRLHERYFGFSEIRMTADSDLPRQLVQAVVRLPGWEELRPRVRYLIHARTMPVVAPHPVNPVEEVRARLGLEGVKAFSVTQHACASGLLAVDLVGRLLGREGDPDALALVVTGEKAFTTCARVITDTGVMGECSAAVLVGAGGTRDRLLAYATHTHGRFDDGAWLTAQAAAEFHDLYPQALADVVREAVDRAGITVADVRLILPHNVNRMSWLRVLRLLGIRGADRLFLDNLPVTGHCFGADAFVNYNSARGRGLLEPGDRYLMTAVGLGATFSAMVLEH